MTLPTCFLQLELSDGNIVEVSATRRLNSTTIDEVREFLEVYRRCLKTRLFTGTKLEEFASAAPASKPDMTPDSAPQKASGT